MIVDTNVYLSHWPTRRLPLDETAKLTAKLEAMDVASAWAGSFDGLLHKDVATVNRRLAEQCKRYGDGRLVAMGSINPTLPDWREDLRRCHEDHQMPGIRLHPNYHGYQLDDPRFALLLSEAQRRGLMVQLAVKMEDERTQHRLLQVKSVDTAPLVELVRRHAGLRLVLLNSLRSLRADALDRLAAAGRVYFEISMLEGVGGIARMLQSVPLDRILFGSYLPFFSFESALLKLRESELGSFQVEAISHETAEQLL